jgi:hypothetical protein
MTPEEFTQVLRVFKAIARQGAPAAAAAVAEPF